MSRPAQEVLEFDKLRDLLRQRTTCAPGRRSVDELGPANHRAELDSVFQLIREAREWLRLARELGFGALADPGKWLARLEAPGAVLEAGDFLDAASLLETTAWLRQQFREESAKFPLLSARTKTLADFRDIHAAIRRSILPNGEISDGRRPLCAAFARACSRHATPFKGPCGKFFDHAKPNPAKTSSRCATTVL